MSRWGPRPEPPCSWAHCRSSLAHTLDFFLEAAGFDLTDGSSGNAGAGIAGPLEAAESHSYCCCSSHSNSLNSSSRWWSVRYSPDALPKEQTERDHERKGEKDRQVGARTRLLSTTSVYSGARKEGDLPEQQQEQVWQL